MKEITSDCHLNEEKRLSKVADSKKKQGRNEAKKTSAELGRKSNQGSLEREEKKVSRKNKKSSSEDTDQQKQGIELINVLTKELKLGFVPPPPFSFKFIQKKHTWDPAG